MKTEEYVIHIDQHLVHFLLLNKEDKMVDWTIVVGFYVVLIKKKIFDINKHYLKI
jgi:hypothetical protein